MEIVVHEFTTSQRSARLVYIYLMFCSAIFFTVCLQFVGCISGQCYLLSCLQVCIQLTQEVYLQVLSVYKHLNLYAERKITKNIVYLKNGHGKNLLNSSTLKMEVTTSSNTLLKRTRIHSIRTQQASTFLFLLGDTSLGR
jgi:hypothetical protein